MLVRAIVRSQEAFAGACQGAGFTLNLVLQSAAWTRLAWKRRREIVSFLFTTTLGSMPLIVITALFTGMIIAMQTGIELAKYGQEEALGFVVATTICRGMGPVFTAIAVTALIGSTIAAEIGTMKVSEEIDALEVMSINPVYFLVMPRIMAVALALPILTIYTDLIGTLGGAAVAAGKFGVSMHTYFDNAREILKLKDVYGGLIKAFVFGICIAAIACSQGLRASHGAEGVGRATLRSVVISFIFILIFEYILTWIIYQD
jgi:phospholipid/cholesterol/gamma-HCH transport system permease protein